MALVYFLSILAFAAAAGLILYFGGREAMRQRRENLSRYSMLLIRLPFVPHTKESRAGELSKFEGLLKRLFAFDSNCIFETFVEHIGEDVHFHLSVPRAFAAETAEEIYRLWPGARVEAIHSDAGIFRSHGVSIGGYVVQKKEHAVSIKTHRNLEHDPFESILKAFAAVQKIGEGAGIQVVLQPLKLRRKKDLAKSFRALDREKRKEFAKDASIERPPAETAWKEIAKAGRRKLYSPVFAANVRICVSAGNKMRAEEVLKELAAAFDHFKDEHHNELKFVRPRSPEKLIENFVARRFEESESMVLGSEEIASFYHFPALPHETARIRWLRLKQMPAPAHLPARGTIVGNNEFRNETRPVYMGEGERHLFAVGEKGTGKSTLLGNLILQDIQRGRGVALIDPEGTLADILLTRIPTGRLNDVVYLNMEDKDRVPGIDPFAWGRGLTEKIFMARELSEILEKFFAVEVRGPMFEEYIRNGLMLLSEAGENFLDLPRVFTEKRYRTALISKSKNNAVIDFWEHRAANASAHAALDRIIPDVLSRFERFAMGPLRAIFSHPQTAVDIESAVGNNKIILIGGGKNWDSASGKLLQLACLSKILAGVIVGSAEGGRGRRKFNIYVDEFCGYATETMVRVLSNEYQNVHLCIAAESAGALEENIREAFLQNPISTVAFRVSEKDAEVLAGEFKPTISAQDFVCMGDLEAYAKIACEGRLTEPFNIRIRNDSWELGNRGFARLIKESCRAAYGRALSWSEKKHVHSKTRVLTKSLVAQKNR